MESFSQLYTALLRLAEFVAVGKTLGLEWAIIYKGVLAVLQPQPDSIASYLHRQVVYSEVLCTAGLCQYHKSEQNLCIASL